MAQWVENPNSVCEDAGSILASLSGLRIGIAVSCGVGRRCSSDLVMLWLWCRLAAAAPNCPLAWEPPYAASAALKTKKKKKKKKEQKKQAWALLPGARRGAKERIQGAGDFGGRGEGEGCLTDFLEAVMRIFWSQSLGGQSSFPAVTK